MELRHNIHLNKVMSYHHDSQRSSRLIPQQVRLREEPILPTATPAQPQVVIPQNNTKVNDSNSRLNRLANICVIIALVADISLWLANQIIF